MRPPSLETNHRPQEGATFGAPHPSQRTPRERRFLCPFVSSWGAPKPGPPLQQRGGGDPDPLTLSPRSTPPAPPPAAPALDRFWARREAREGSGAPKVPRMDRGVGRRGLASPGPPHRPLDLALRAPPPNSIPHPRPAGPLPALNTPTWAPIQLSSGAAASPRYCAFYGAPHGQNLHPLWYRQNPHYSSTYRPPVNNPGPPSCGAIRHPHYGVSFSDPGPNPDPSKRSD